MLKALLDVELRGFISDAGRRLLRFLQARPVLARHRSQKTTSRCSKVFNQQAVPTLAMLPGVARTAGIKNQPIEPLEAGLVQHYLVPTGANFVR